MANGIFVFQTPHTVHPRLNDLFQKLERKRELFLKSIEQLSAEEFTKRPLEGQWSVSEVLAHLQTSEQLSLQYMNKKILGIQQTKATHIGHELLMAVVKASQRLPLKFRAPQVVTTHTPSYDSVEQLKIAWLQTREQMKQLLEKFEDHQLKKQIYRHPVAGLINIQHAVIFFREHMIHHQRQLNRTIRAVQKK